MTEMTKPGDTNPTCPGKCDYDAQNAYWEHTVDECGGPWGWDQDPKTLVDYGPDNGHRWEDDGGP